MLASEPKGAPPAVPNDAKEILSAKDFKVWYPIKSGVFRRTVGHVKAVDNVTFKIRYGEAVGIVGESGSGKT
ncbi:MAG: ATP-binding cassette domain-containing protein, partial [Rhodospirillaceae bacterium]|nr:ATP-binding cassette domain-containing protein [Rhodospirillaceae bacterium]